tara:strand:- start:1858 stop:2496 length:639 start_codon:yes stop_codon:yes gene_type:complete
MNKDAMKILQSSTPEELIKHRPSGKDKFGKEKMLDYIDARFCMDRLDEAVGPLNWRQEFQSINGTLFCGVSILTKGGEWITKWDCGTESNFEKEKGLASDAFKRACVSWGIARDLYDADRKKNKESSVLSEKKDGAAKGDKPKVASSGNSEVGDPGLMPFGKHKGKPIKTIPDSYFKWCVDNMDHNSDALDFCVGVLNRRSEEPTDDKMGGF